MKDLKVNVKVHVTERQWELLTRLAQQLVLPEKKVIENSCEQIVRVGLPDFFKAIELEIGSKPK